MHANLDFKRIAKQQGSRDNLPRSRPARACNSIGNPQDVHSSPPSYTETGV
jgi:hypothetical protein